MALGPTTWDELFFKELRRIVDPTLSYRVHISEVSSGAFGNVNGHGVRIEWKSIELGGISTASLTISPERVVSMDAPMLRSDEMTVTTERDPGEVAAEIAHRLSR